MPSRPGLPQVILQGAATVLLQWAAPLYPRGNLTQYAIFSQDSSFPFAIVRGQQTQVTLTLERQKVWFRTSCQLEWVFAEAINLERERRVR